MRAKTEILKVKGDWEEVVDDCRATVKKEALGKEPSSKFKKDILIAEHDPIRDIEIKWTWRGIKYWCAMHWKTHIWRSRTNTQRTDRTGIPRDDKPQGETVNFIGDANCQHLIDTARKRLCYMADPETRMYADDLKLALKGVEPELSDVLVPNCIYRAGCPELNGGCGWYKKMLERDADFGSTDIATRYAAYNRYFHGG